jgi:hypothetical protein
MRYGYPPEMSVLKQFFQSWHEPPPFSQFFSVRSLRHRAARSASPILHAAISSHRP